MEIRLKRIYDPPAGNDGVRILVDHLWPRGVRRENARLDEWLKEFAPSDSLRRWYKHDTKKWGEFQRRYCDELLSKREQIVERFGRWRQTRVPLVYSSRETVHNNAAVLKDFLEKNLPGFSES
jgi:uncharacterized protein YeaO (DUF488 family)